MACAVTEFILGAKNAGDLGGGEQVYQHLDRVLESWGESLGRYSRFVRPGVMS